MTDLNELLERAHPEDECECGDYRRHHENGLGRCCMPDDLTHGNVPCFSFRLAFRHAGPSSREAIREGLSALISKEAQS